MLSPDFPHHKHARNCTGEHGKGAMYYAKVILPRYYIYYYIATILYFFLQYY